MNANVARAVARELHAGQVGRSGEPLIDHVERVARAVPPDIRHLAYLHDVLERADGATEVLGERGLTDEEWSVLTLLARRPTESYRAYVRRVARADGTPGRVARTIKLADLKDHLAHTRVRGGAPNYAWALEQIVQSQRMRGEAWTDAGEMRVA